jgi:hypothetical protein
MLKKANPAADAPGAALSRDQSYWNHKWTQMNTHEAGPEGPLRAVDSKACYEKIFARRKELNR